MELEQVSKVYGHGSSAFLALCGINLHIAEGEFIAITGPSGSGKSTMINILGLLDSPSSGKFRFHGTQVEHMSQDQRALLRRHYMGFVFQGFNLLPRTTALENVQLPLIYRGVPASKRKELARNALSWVGLTEWETHTAAELSGGQQQRVAIARALVTAPLILLADEPTGNLDSQNGQEIMQLLRALNENRGITIGVVTHDSEISSYANRFIHFKDGRIVRDTAFKDP